MNAILSIPAFALRRKVLSFFKQSELNVEMALENDIINEALLVYEREQTAKAVKQRGTAFV